MKGAHKYGNVEYLALSQARWNSPMKTRKRHKQSKFFPKASEALTPKQGTKQLKHDAGESDTNHAGNVGLTRTNKPINWNAGMGGRHPIFTITEIGQITSSDSSLLNLYTTPNLQITVHIGLLESSNIWNNCVQLRSLHILLSIFLYTSVHGRHVDIQLTELY